MTAERTTRAICGMNTMPIASIAFGRLGPSTETMTMASRMLGKDRITSMRRISTESGQRPTYPATTPMMVPTPVAIATAASPAVSEILAQRVVRRDQGRKDGHQDEDAYDGRPEDRQAVRKERAQQVLPAAARLDAGCGYRVVLDLGLGHLSTSPGDRGSRRGCPRGGSPARRAGPRRGLRPGSWRSPGGRRTRRRCNPPPARRRSSPL